MYIIIETCDIEDIYPTFFLQTQRLQACTFIPSHNLHSSMTLSFPREVHIMAYQHLLSAKADFTIRAEQERRVATCIKRSPVLHGSCVGIPMERELGITSGPLCDRAVKLWVGGLCPRPGGYAQLRRRETVNHVVAAPGTGAVVVGSRSMLHDGRVKHCVR